VYGEALAHTWAWLREREHEDVVDFGVASLPLPEPEELATLTAPSRHAPVLLPAHLDLWAQTSSPPPAPDPEVGVWLHGPDQGTAEVQVIWRCDVAALLEGPEGGDCSASLALRPRSAEALSLPFATVKRWLRGEAEGAEVSDLEASPAADELAGRRTPPAERPFLHWRGDGGLTVSQVKSLRPGSTIIVPCSYGGLDRATWHPGAEAPVPDIAEIAALRQRQEAVLRLHPAILQRLWGERWPSLLGAPPTPGGSDEEDPDEERERVHAWLRQAPPVEPAWLPAWEALCSARRITLERFEASETEGASVPAYYLMRAPGRVPLPDAATSTEEEASTDGDEGSFLGTGVTLAEHQAGVAEWVARFAQALGLEDAIRRDLVESARAHDWGKIDPRFQLLLHGGSEYLRDSAEADLAKSSVQLRHPRARVWARERSGYPAGARHELLSVALLQSLPEAARPVVSDWDLVLHLVGSHHGHCRPWVPVAPDVAPLHIETSFGDTPVTCSTKHGLEALDSGVIDRFWRLVRRYGWWGLAFLETLLRLADHRRSQEEESR
jgi:CRISPR-associated endonuclease/helicase Cas3